MKLAATMVRLLFFAILASAALGNKVRARVSLRQNSGRVEVREQRLRVCNAYPFEAALELYLGDEKLTKDKPMRYKTCADFSAPLKRHDRLNFKIGDHQAGTFSVSDLPEKNSQLLLVIHRHNAESTTASFDSHMFDEDAEDSQIAVIDTYTGTSSNMPEINTKVGRELLRFGRVIAVKPDYYSLKLVSHKNQTHAQGHLLAEKGKNYVVMRVGIDAKQGPSFPEELVTFPNEEGLLQTTLALKSGASTNRGFLLGLVVLAAALLDTA